MQSCDRGTEMSLHEVLGVSERASDATIAWVYRRLCECYEIVVTRGDMREVRHLAEKRLEHLGDIGKGLPTADTADGVKTTQSVLSKAREALANEPPLRGGSIATYRAEVQSLPPSAEKEYVLALLALQEDRSNAGFRDAHIHLLTAIQSEPDNLVYCTLEEAVKCKIDGNRGLI